MKGNKQPKALVLSLCVADLKHEWLLSLCMIMAVASVLAPLLILFGLKFGTIETLKERLINDPKNREIRPMSIFPYTKDWFKTFENNQHVEFIIPYTRQLASSVDLSLASTTEKNISVDVLPTAKNDSLLIQNNTPVPLTEAECVLTEPAANAMNAKVGDNVIMFVRRLQNGKIESVEHQIKVIAVAPIRAGATKATFVPLSLLEAIESFKDGLAVPRFGWKGALALAQPSFASMLVQSPKALGAELEFKMINNTGFVENINIKEREAQVLVNRTLPQNEFYYLLKTKGSQATLTNIKAVEYLLRGRDSVLYPLIEQQGFTLHSDTDNLVLSVNIFPALPFNSLDNMAQDKEFFSKLSPTHQADSDNSKDWRRSLIVSPDIIKKFEGKQTFLSAKIQDKTLSFPIRLISDNNLKDNNTLASFELTGILGLLQTRPIAWNKEEDNFLLVRRSYAGFRMYANSLDSVAILKNELEAMGLTVSTEAERIDEVKNLDKSLSLIFWLIASGAVVGGIASLVANIYAGIERKRRELAVLRLLGLSGSAFLRFPLYTAGIFASLGFVVAMFLFSFIAITINQLFGSHLQTGESLCRLAWWHPLFALLLTLVVALCSGLLAARRAINVDPATALRNE